jgi:RNA polymerase sigma-54 factor
MKQTLQLRLGQQLAMTPQLQQAIRLLQLSTLELHAEVQDALDSNLMLEVDESESVAADGADGVEQEVAPSDIPQELPVDSAWDEIYDGATAGPPASGGSNDANGMDLDVHRSAEATLASHLESQVELLRLSDTDQAIGLAIVDAIDEDGYFGTSVEDLCQALVEQGFDIEVDEVQAVLHQVQNLDPPGVAARDLGECLVLQLRQLPADTPWREEATQLARDHLEALAARDYALLTRSLGVEKDDLQDVVGLIRTLNPRPGGQVASAAPEYVVPDVFVRKVKGVWRVELNVDAFPRLRVNPSYAALVRRADNSTDNNCLKSHLQEARWFIKSLRSRSETLLKVASCIVERQQAFLEHGEEAMKPMVLHDVAEAVGMHESTISRVTTQKYMHTPRGIFELKYFFSSHVYTKSGGECSSTAIRALLKKLIAAENPSKPLSDSKLAGILSDQGIQVARRTVAKYREAMAIPSSSDRKALI